MRFVKMHGIGNDYVYLDAVTRPEIEARADLPALARAISHRHAGVGSDGLILLCTPRAPDTHVRMRMFNADGSESEMCGNGVRCVAKFAHDRLGVRARPMRVETGRGVLAIDYEVRSGRVTRATVDMGAPILDLDKIPVDAARLGSADRIEPAGGAPAGWTVRLGLPARGGTFVGVPVSMGNPHATFFADENEAALGPPLPWVAEGARPADLAAINLASLGPEIERHAAFPRRVNVHVARAHARDRGSMRTWERGAGLTQACGTGACAVLVAGVLTGRFDRRAELELPGGSLDIQWDRATGHVLMTGPAADVFEGDWPDA